MATAEFAALPQQAAHPTAAPATPVAARSDTDPELQLESVATAANDDDDSGPSNDGKPRPDGPAPKGAAPLGYQRVLFEQLRQALHGGDSATATAAATALPWLLQRFCVALRHQQTLAAAGLHLALQTIKTTSRCSRPTPQVNVVSSLYLLSCTPLLLRCVMHKLSRRHCGERLLDCPCRCSYAGGRVCITSSRKGR